MKRRMGMSMLAIVIMFALVLSGCSNGSVAEQAPDTDFLGRALPKVGAVNRIVSLTASNTETLFALGLGDKIVGVDAYSDYPAEVADIEKVGDFNGPNIEAIVALEPDLVLAGNKLQAETVTQLEALGLTVMAAEASTYDDIFKSILMIGSVTGAEDAANELVAQMREKEASIKDAVKGLEAPSVYYAISYGEAGNWTSGPGSFINVLIEKANGTCVTTEGVSGESAAWMEYSNEVLVLQNPDIVLLSSYAGGIEGLKTAAGFMELKAVTSGSVLEVDATLTERPGPRIVDGLEAIAKALHPEAFK